MKVYAVEECLPYEGCRLLALFSTNELAEEYADKDMYLVVTEMEVDSEVEEEAG